MFKQADLSLETNERRRSICSGYKQTLCDYLILLFQEIHIPQLDFQYSIDIHQNDAMP
jgi:hypothetical protein